MKTTEQQIKRLQKEIAMIREYIVPLENIDVKASVVANSFLSMKVEGLDDIKKITTLMPPSGENFELTFAGKFPILTYSPFSIHVNNYSHGDATEATVKYKSEKIDIWITVPIDNFNIEREVIEKQVKRGSEYVYITEGYNVSVVLGQVQVYAGVGKFGSRVTYASNEDEAYLFNEEFMTPRSR